MQAEPARWRPWLVGSLSMACSASPPISRPTLDDALLRTDGPLLLDALDRQVILRGVNAGGSSKLPPFLPFPYQESGDPLQVDAPPFDDALAAYVDRVVRWGHNTVRLPFVWEAVEPERGVYDTDFLDRYATVARAFGEAGMHVIIDAHQDVYGRHYCGSGAPAWSVEPSVPPKEGDCADWFQGYLGDPVVDAAYARLWRNDDGILDAFYDAWEQVIEVTANLPGVIAVEPMNEPHAGSVDKAWWTDEVMPAFWQEIADRAHARNPDLLVLLDTTGQDGIFGRTDLRPPDGDRWIMAPHYYSPAVYLAGPENATWDVTAGLRPWADFAQEHDLPVLIGEFGSVTGTEAAARYLDDNWRALDAHLMHGTAWEYSTRLDDWNDEGFGFFHAGEPTPSVDVLPHAYPAAVAGRIETWTWDRATGTGTLTWQAYSGITEIVVPEEPAAVEVEGAVTAWGWSDGRLLLDTTDGLAKVLFR